MLFSEKLNFLMDLTNTTNSALALNIKLDPSHISRLRRGERRALKNEACITAMASYFTRHCERDYQQRALAEALSLDYLSCDEKKLSDSIARWLLSGDRNDNNTVESFLSGFAKIKNKHALSAAADQVGLPVENAGSSTDVYFGIKGKRLAVINFLSTVIARDKPQTLLLFSDEATDWMADDRDFAVQWAFLMAQFLSKGGSIKIIHTVSRDLDEMMSALGQWMPLYMFGSIEPYYYPKKRDGVFKRTLFISPNVAAVISTSVGAMRDQAANVLLRDRSAVASYEREFLEYLSMCRPLMRVFTTKDEKAYFDALSEFENIQSDAIIKTDSLSLVTMPENTFASVASRLEGTDQGFSEYQKERVALFEKNLQAHAFIEIVALPELQALAEGKVKVSFSDMLAGQTVFYTAEEYAQHLKNLLLLFVKYENFRIKLTASSSEESYMVYVSEDVGAIVAKTAAPPVILAIDENNMKAAFWDYLKSIAGSVEALGNGREATKKKLSDYIAELEKALLS
ncbi:MAG: transcriptional regulator [Oscillospiraceae bacterium]